MGIIWCSRGKQQTSQVSLGNTNLNGWFLQLLSFVSVLCYQILDSMALLGGFSVSTVWAVSENMTFECKRSCSRKARQSFHNLLKIVFHTWLVYYQVSLMIGEIPISDVCHYMDAHDTETVYQTQRGWERCCSSRWVCNDESNRRQLVYGRGLPRRTSNWSWESHNWVKPRSLEGPVVGLPEYYY